MSRASCPRRSKQLDRRLDKAARVLCRTILTLRATRPKTYMNNMVAALEWQLELTARSFEAEIPPSRPLARLLEKVAR